MFKTLQEMKSQAIKIGHSSNEKCFISKCEMLAFVTDCTLFAVPWSHSALKVLCDNSFERSNKIELPYCDQFINKTNRSRWIALENAAHEEKRLA